MKPSALAPAPVSAHSCAQASPLAKPTSALSAPPGPSRRWWGLPLLGEMRRDYLAFETRMHREHGDISLMRLGSEHAWNLMTPDLAREALVTQAQHLVRWERGIEVFAQAFGQSVLVTEGDTWQRQRRMLMPAFTPKKVAEYAALMCDAGQNACDELVPPGQTTAHVAMDAMWSQVAMDVILRVLFGRAAQSDTALAAQATQTLSATAYLEMFQPFTLPDWLPLPGKAAKRGAMRMLHGLVRRHIEAQARHGATDTLLGMLLSLRDADTGQPLSDQEVFDQCMVSFQAGHETSATALLWWSHLMASHPPALQRAQAEVDAVLGMANPTPGHLARLPWLTATLKEALRLYPPISALMTRRTTAPITVGGWAIPKGHLLRVTPWVIHRDERWFPQPDQFLPERFMDGSVEIPRGAWLPFGTGPRVCIGQHFAMLEMTVLAAMLLQRYRLHLPPGAPAPQPVMHVTLRPEHPMVLVLERR